MNLIYKIDLVVILVSVFILIFAVGYSRPLVISPLDDYETRENSVLFSIDKADVLLIDDNSDFTTPEEYYIKDGLKINLLPGDYYWKAIGIFDSEVRSLTIKSEVDLEIKELGNDEYNVVNVGNVDLNVEVYDGDNLVDRVRVGVLNGVNSSGDKFIGGQYE